MSEVNQKCSVCGDTENILDDCEYARRGFGAVCKSCCENCYKTEPFPCRDYEKRRTMKK